MNHQVGPRNGLLLLREEITRSGKQLLDIIEMLSIIYLLVYIKSIGCRRFNFHGKFSFIFYMKRAYLKSALKNRVMIQCHSNIQLFTTLPMWQGGPSLLFEFFNFFKIN
jgi:hypothetical protein